MQSLALEGFLATLLSFGSYRVESFHRPRENKVGLFEDVESHVYLW